MHTFIRLAETEQYGTSGTVVEEMWAEALKCAINSIYDRPSFVNEFNAEQGFEKIAALLKVAFSCVWRRTLFKDLD